VTEKPARYTIHIYIDTQALAQGADVARIVAHLPEGAPLWLQGEPTKQRGAERTFESPTLLRGFRYSYSARVEWFEDGKWVSQTVEVPVWAGKTTCLAIGKPAALTAALDELDPADRKMAAEQGFCAAQPMNRLGAMGKPHKAMVKGQPVFLCCEGCAKHAQRNPDKILATVKELREKNVKAGVKEKR
jgi:uncharacterized protein (TIGR03000 family)